MPLAPPDGPLRPGQALLDDLCREVSGLLIPSETDSPIWVEEVPGGPTSAWLRQRTAQPADAPIEVESVEAFLRPLAAVREGSTEEEAAKAARFVSLLGWIDEGLRGAVVYRVGRRPLIDVVLVGQAPRDSRIWIALLAQLVET